MVVQSDSWNAFNLIIFLEGRSDDKNPCLYSNRTHNENLFVGCFSTEPKQDSYALTASNHLVYKALTIEHIIPPTFAILMIMFIETTSTHIYHILCLNKLTSCRNRGY